MTIYVVVDSSSDAHRGKKQDLMSHIAGLMDSADVDDRERAKPLALPYMLPDAKFLFFAHPFYHLRTFDFSDPGSLGKLFYPPPPWSSPSFFSRE